MIVIKFTNKCFRNFIVISCPFFNLCSVFKLYEIITLGEIYMLSDRYEWKGSPVKVLINPAEEQNKIKHQAYGVLMM